MEGIFEKKRNGFMVVGSIIAIKSKASKGGAVQILVECPLNSKLAQSAYEYFERSGVMTFEAEEAQQELPGFEGSEETDKDTLLDDPDMDYEGDPVQEEIEEESILI